MTGDALPRSLHRRIRTLYINLIHALRRVCENRHVVVQYFHETAGQRDDLLWPLVGSEPQLARHQRRHERCVTREYGHLPLGAGRDYEICATGIGLTFRCLDV